MATERSSLVDGEQRLDGTSGEFHAIDSGVAPGPAMPGLRWRAQRLIEQHANTSSRYKEASQAETWRLAAPMDQLAVHLFALNLLRNPSTVTKAAIFSAAPPPLSDSVQSVLGDYHIRMERCEALVERIRSLLDTQLLPRTAVDAVHIVGEKSSAKLLPQGTEELEIAFWRPRAVDDAYGTFQSIPDLLLPDLESMSSPWLSHPFIRVMAERVWSQGLPASITDCTLKRVLKSACTPRRLNVLHLASFLVLHALTISLCVRPGTRISPYTLNEKKLKTAATTREVWWIVFVTVGLLGRYHSKYNPHSVYFVRQFAITAIFSSSSLGISDTTRYYLLCASIPFLTLSLIFPVSASFPLLFHRSGIAIMPLSTLLVNLLSASVRIIGIIFSSLLALFALLFWAMGGDLRRGGLIPAADLTNTSSMTSADPASADPGTIPFQARLSIFVTLCLVLFCAIRLYVARASAVPSSHADSREYRSSSSAMVPDDDWEREHGLRTGRIARAYLLDATRILLPPIISDTGPTSSTTSTVDRNNGDIAAAVGRDKSEPIKLPGAVEFPIVVPINAISMAADFLVNLISLIGELSSSPVSARRIARALLGVVEWIYLLTAGPPCLILQYAFGWLP